MPPGTTPAHYHPSNEGGSSPLSQNDYDEVLSGNVTQVSEFINSTSDLAVLDKIEAGEHSGQNRAGVQQALDKRRAELAMPQDKAPAEPTQQNPATMAPLGALKTERDPTKIKSGDLTPEDTAALSKLADEPVGGVWDDAHAAKYADMERQVREQARAASPSEAQAHAFEQTAIDNFRQGILAQEAGGGPEAGPVTETYPGGAYFLQDRKVWVNANGDLIQAPPAKPDRKVTERELREHAPLRPGDRPQAEAQPANAR